MTYSISKFMRRYFERYCKEYKIGNPQVITADAQRFYDCLMHDTPDMGKKGNMMAGNLNLVAAFLAYYEASGHAIGGEAIDILTGWLADDYKWVGFFTDMNKRPYVRPLYYKIYSRHARKVNRHLARGEWSGTWRILINPEKKKEGIAYHMSCCPLYAFAKMHGYEDMMPYICKFDFIFEKFLHAKLIRTRTEATGGDCCDYWFVADQSETANKYRDFHSV